MCTFLSTSFRSGTIINAKKRGEDTSGAQIVNTFRDARKIGLQIAPRKDAYLSAITTAFAAKSDARVFCAEDEDVTARFDPGLILDFPLTTIEVGGWTLSARSCLTVCSGQAQSKVWTRVVGNSNFSHRSLSESDVRELHRISKSYAETANDMIVQLYESDFSSAQSLDVSLEKSGWIDVFAVDCAGSEISSAIRDSYSELSWSVETKSIANSELAKTLRRITAVSMPENGQDATSTPEFTLKESSEFVPFHARNGSESVFVATADDCHAYISGLVDAGSDSTAEEKENETDTPKSVGATAELAMQIGAAY
ncbi:hypothetical protein [Ruegeria atlantica]|uniref:hypothetical protein n=1 Tax=Ruegeria atlantica TaxID=81569 RepID=UPI00148BD655|nr:hypothetical protein [Ruegeria atlantica]